MSKLNQHLPPNVKLEHLDEATAFATEVYPNTRRTETPDANWLRPAWSARSRSANMTILTGANEISKPGGTRRS